MHVKLSGIFTLQVGTSSAVADAHEDRGILGRFKTCFLTQRRRASLPGRAFGDHSSVFTDAMGRDRRPADCATELRTATRREATPVRRSQAYRPHAQLIRFRPRLPPNPARKIS